MTRVDLGAPLSSPDPLNGATPPRTTPTTTSRREAVATITLSAGTLYTVLVDGQPHIVLKPAVEDLGLAYSAQLRKLKTRSWAVVAQTDTTGSDGKTYEMATVPVRTFLMLLANVNENRIKDDVRPTLIAFQNETADAVEAYWTRGAAINPRAQQPTALDDPLAEIQRQTDLTRQAVEVALAERAARRAAEHKVAELEPLAEAWEQFANARGLIHPAVFAQQSGIVRPGGKPLGQNSAIKALRELRILKDAPGTDRHNTPYQAHAHRIKTVTEHLGGGLRNVPYIWPRHAHYLRGRILGHLHPAPETATVLYLPAGTEGRAR